MSNRQFVLDAIAKKPVKRVPVGFWFHFASDQECFQGLEDPSIVQKNIEGHKRFFEQFQPDFVKLMSDGFFTYPNTDIGRVASSKELRNFKPVGADHPWIQEQVKLVKELTDTFGSEVVTFYNIFAPATYFKILNGFGTGDPIAARLIKEDPEAVKYVLDVIAEDVKTLSQLVITEGRADGIYFSVQHIQDERITPELYEQVVKPSDVKVLHGANEVSPHNILHICGYEGSKNSLSQFADYDASIINWAVHVEKVGIAEGRKLFNGKTVLGGFANTKKGLLYNGSREEIEQYTEQLISEAGSTGFIIGADCTVPSDISWERLNWVREKAASL